jgi:hypothetical protein
MEKGPLFPFESGNFLGWKFIITVNGLHRNKIGECFSDYQKHFHFPPTIETA